ncbi:MAG: BlaI/MecI/CopY family transcriptional regulator [Phycisphaeraceae bacterium]|nr:BlaI/MecI/CopY family transcriptional regulator [Phycisphaerales bacterium]MCB9860011.1 BlaI/MecI/CopY family transcriptional regulator [Phycisphaeraceae bacterium]
MSQPPLANAELAVMELLWEQDKLTARSIREQLYPSASKAQHGTVQRLLQRLEEKGFIDRDTSLSVHLFSARISREAYAGNQLKSLADKLTGGSLAPLLTHLVEQRRISADELSRLRTILEEAQDETDGEGGWQ